MAVGGFFPGPVMEFIMIKRATSALLLSVLAVLICCAVPASAGEKRQDHHGITVDAANYNSQLIRRSQNRRNRDINSLDQIPVHLYEIRRSREADDIPCALP